MLLGIIPTGLHVGVPNQHALRDHSNSAQSNLTGIASECCCQQGTTALHLSTQSKTHSAVIRLLCKSMLSFGWRQTLAKTSATHTAPLCICKISRDLLSLQEEALGQTASFCVSFPRHALQYRTLVTVYYLVAEVRGLRCCAHSTSGTRRSPTVSALKTTFSDMTSTVSASLLTSRLSCARRSITAGLPAPFRAHEPQRSAHRSSQSLVWSPRRSAAPSRLITMAQGKLRSRLPA